MTFALHFSSDKISTFALFYIILILPSYDENIFEASLTTEYWFYSNSEHTVSLRDNCI